MVDSVVGLVDLDSVVGLKWVTRYGYGVGFGYMVMGYVTVMA